MQPTGPFVHLHVHSAYSLAEGAIPVTTLRDLCLKNGMPAVAVTDTDNLFGALEVSEILSAAGVQPIIGLQLSIQLEGLASVEVRRARPPSIVLLAQNEVGYANLMSLSSKAFLRSAREDGPCAELDWLDDNGDGLICLSGGFEGPLDRLFRAERKEEAEAFVVRLARTFPRRFYIELQRHEARRAQSAEHALIELAYTHGLPLVATNEPFFPARADHEAHDALLCVAEGAYVHQEDRRSVTNDHYFKSSEEMAALFADLPEAVNSTVEIARRCAFRPRSRPPILPSFVEIGSGVGGSLGDNREAENVALAAAARAGLNARLASTTPAAEREAYVARLDFELDVIGGMGFAGYFLIVADFIQWAKRHGIPVGPGRGSGAGSLVAYALTITDLDPLRFGLLFERFLNPSRVSMPDFDIDFCQERRDEVIRYVRERYGADRVAQIITFGKLQARAVLRDVGRVLGMPFGLVDRLCKLVPNNPASPVTLGEAIELEPRLREERDRDPGVATLLDTALKLEGLYRHASTHAAGVVIGDRPLVELTPLYRDPGSDMPATQYNMKWVEHAGLVKFDFLGLKTLTVIERAATFVREIQPDFLIDAVPLNDRKSFDMLGEGAAVGVFQLESAGMRATLRAMKPDTLEDIIALVSLYRPGPMENIPTYIERKQGLDAPDYLHPSLEPVLKETYGVIIYQEQVMQIAQILSGFSLGEADLLRRAMGKKKKEEMDLQRRRFVDGAAERGVPSAKASSIFDLVQKFAGYGFNKSHAAAYAFIAYQTAYLKANHPAAFLAASMSLDRSNTDKLAVFVGEARRSGVRIEAPHINVSEADFAVRSGAIVYALAAVKNVGDGAIAEIARERRAHGKFENLHDFAERVDLRIVGKRALESLARAGAFDGLCQSRAEALASCELLVRYSGAVHEERGSAQAGLFDASAGPSLARPKLIAAEQALSIDQLNDERAALGFYLSGHPLDDYETALKRLNAMTWAEAIEAARRGRIAARIGAVVRSLRLRRSKAGKPFAWIEFSDASGDFEATAFSETLADARDLLEPGRLVLLGASVEERDGEARFTCERVRPLDVAAAQTASQIRVSLASASALGALKRRLASVKPASPQEAGDVFVRLHLGGAAGREVDMDLGVKVACTPAVKGALKATEGVLDVELL